MKRIAVTLSLCMVAVLPASVVAGSSSADQNHPRYWEQQTGDECFKIENPSTPFKIGDRREGKEFTLLVIKAGSAASTDEPHHQVADPDRSTKYRHPSGKQISHVILCYRDTSGGTGGGGTGGGGGGTGGGGATEGENSQPSRRVAAPRARILGPCGDPMYAFVLNNRRSDRPVTFRVQFFGRHGWTTIKRTVGSGERVKTQYRWVKGHTRMTIQRGNGDLLARERSAAPGFYRWGHGECRR